MKKGLLIILFLGIIPQGFSQTLTPEFEFQLYFEDAVGNKDTVTLGYDALATAGIDADFGEVNILNEPWGENLDVRIGNSRYLTDIPIFLSKIQVFSPFCGLGNSHQYPFSDEATIHFYTSNYPLTITWNQTLFENDTCLQNSIIYNEFHGFDIEGYLMMTNSISDSIIIDTNLNTIFSSDKIETYYDDSKQIGMLKFMFGEVSTLKATNVGKEPELKVYPNPLNQGEQLLTNYTGNYKLVDNMGNIIMVGNVQNGKLDFSLLKEGVYFLNLYNANNSNVYKLIIQ